MGPYWGVCTLVICKPVIRRNAEVGDWIVGTGSKRFGFENKVVYAMEVTQKLTMEEYDAYCQKELQNKIPKWDSNIYEKIVGDCIYDFSVTPSLLRASVHNEGNRPIDLGGKYALLSDHFYYFGNKPIQLPENLLEIVKQGQGHKSTSNNPYFHPFIDWIITRKEAKNIVFSEPQDKHLFEFDRNCLSRCAVRNKINDEADEELGDE